MSKIFNGEWWTAVLPDRWKIRSEEHGASFFRIPRRGTLQISAACREQGPVSDADLRGFAGDRTSTGHQLQEIRLEAFSGFQCVYSEGHLQWSEWWLSHGPFMIYATYVVPSDKANAIEKQEVEVILRSLALRP